MSTNGHFPDISRGEVERIMDEWSDLIKSTKERLHGKITRDARPFQERELDILITRIIPGSFGVDAGSVPDENGKNDDRLWNYPEFAKIINGRAKRLNTTTKILITWAFDFLLRHEPDGRVKVLIILFGAEFVKRVLGDKDEINRISKRHNRADSSDDPEELKIIPELTRSI